MKQKNMILPFRVGTSSILGIRGIIATDKIEKGQIIERCPALVYEANDRLINQTIFSYYVFEWDKTHEALALGYGSLYNHSYHPNVTVDFDEAKMEILFIAKREINEGEELFINYNDDGVEMVDAGYLDFDAKIRN